MLLKKDDFFSRVYFLFFASLIYWSRAIDIDVAVLLGTTISAINLFSLREFNVVLPNTAILVSFCSKSGKFCLKSYSRTKN